MRLKLSVRASIDFLTKNYFWMIVCCYTASVFVQQISIGVVSGLLSLFIFAAVIIKRKGHVRNIHVVIYILMLLLSGIKYLINGLPINLYFTGIVYNLLPIALYFGNRKDLSNLYGKSFSAIFYSLIIGVLFYIWAPLFYGEYLVKHNHLNYWFQVRTSLQGLYGITMVGSFSACCTIYYYGQWLVYNRKKDFLKAFISGLIMLFAGRRSAMAACLLLFIVENVVFYKTLKYNKRRQILIGVIAIFGLVLAILLDGGVIATWFERLTSVTAAVSERSSNWALNLDTIKANPIFGNGLGSSGHLASATGYVGVHDNSYLLILAENGILGLLALIAIIARTIRDFVKINNKQHENYIALFVVLAFLIQAIGSNVWEFPVLAALFWTSLSCCSINVVSDNDIQLQN